MSELDRRELLLGERARQRVVAYALRRPATTLLPGTARASMTAWHHAPAPGSACVDSFYAYAGSLTTPGCIENVRWSVLAAGGQVSQPAVARFHSVLAKFADYGIRER